MHALTINQLSFTYPNQPHPVLRNVSISVARGEIVGLLGPSGAGKSTTQKILLKLLSGYHGSVHVFGKELRQWGQEYYQQIGVSFELPNHYPKLSAYENLQLFAQLYGSSDARIMPLLERVGLAQDAHKRVAQYSKGMQMRLMLVRALLHHPQLVFLDEPTSGLDPNNALRIKEVVQSYRDAGTTVFVTTHDMTVASEWCDRVAFMVAGELVVCDHPQALMRAHGARTLAVTYVAPDDTNRIDTYVAQLDTIAHDATFQHIVQDAYIVSIHSQEATLADVFTRVTGEVLT